MLTKKHVHVRKDDQVEVTCGDEAGKRGRILRTLPEKGRVVVEGINYVWKHLRRSQKHPQGGRLQVEAPISAANVMLVCQSCGAATRVKSVVRVEPRDGGAKKATFRYRVCKKCGNPVSPKDKEYAEKKGA